ncbi:gelsolin repeat-containing protein [Lindgomyces ingoldianus]|uniref:Gelsolin repeat-containing protein n=1 Tax=Lindgomyces ingoldianus TaxID=673940 RepID=A0ACB6R9N0_9PLEO|nr:gelsolin repeat-containing protein [Lindgomyces ingoldianus]KAF2475040.1 gelsolin repeat-containing protein [Lindgomyces ingoldianus]
MPPHKGLVHPKEYDWRDSNVELINSSIDHKIKYQSATTEPAWNNGIIGIEPGLFVWRIEDFEVVPWPKEKYGQFHEGDSYIILHTEKEGKNKMIHDIFFYLGSHTTQDEAGAAAYKTVELDEYLHGTATQYRELQNNTSDDFLALFPKIKILRGGVASGFTHVAEEENVHVDMLLRIFKHPSLAASRDAIMVHEVEPTWQSLDENDVFVLDRGDKIFVWQGQNCAPMEKLKAAQVVNDLTLAKHVEVEVLSQSETRSKVVVDYLGGRDVDVFDQKFVCERPAARREEGRGGMQEARKAKKLFKLSDKDGELSFTAVSEGENVNKGDFDGNDVFLLDSTRAIWVWEGKGASRAEKASWLKVAQAYVRHVSEDSSMSIGKVVEGNESQAFWAAVGA